MLSLLNSAWITFQVRAVDDRHSSSTPLSCATNWGNSLRLPCSFSEVRPPWTWRLFRKTLRT
jgi:hypothetical protein